MSLQTRSVRTRFPATWPTPMILPEEVRAFRGAAPRGGARWYCGIQFFIWRRFLMGITSGDKQGQLQRASHR